jgi:hypothetical protein
MPFGSLWIPVIVSAVAVFLGSSIIHMALKYHQADYRALPGEEAVREALGKSVSAPGVYVTPYCQDMKQMKDPAMMEKYAKGPVALITLYPKGPIALPKLLALWFGFSIFVSFVAAYVARITLMPGADGMLVMRVTGTVAFAAYGLSHVSDSIWKGQPWSNTGRSLIDSILYSLLTGLTFRLLWPGA